MDNITHTLVGLTLSRTALERAGVGTTAALVIASNIPDIDVVMAVHGGRATYLADHRAFTHSIFGIIVLAFVTAVLVRLWHRQPWRKAQRDARGPAASLAALFGISLIATTVHVLLDLATPYGTRLLSPLSGVWYSTDWMPIVDVYLLAILIGGTAAFLLRPARRRAIAVGVLVLSAGYYGLRAATHRAALHEAGVELTARGVTACTPEADPTRAGWLELQRWSGTVSGTAPSTPASVTGGAAQPCVIETAAIPTFLSPFVWRIIERYSDFYELADIDVRPRWLSIGANAPRLQRVWIPAQHTAAIAEAETAAPARAFLRFARFPAAHASANSAGVLVSLTDMRFIGGITSLMPARPQTAAFLVTVELDRNGRVSSARFGP